MTTLLDGLSHDIHSEKLSQLHQIMPELFREGNLDPDALKKFFGNGYETAERYGLGRAGKSQAVNVIKQRTSLTLHPEQEKSVDWDTTENLFIEGDNLDVLRILQKSYYNKIKMIYIDPPYNTGSDAFVYPDDYSMSTSEYNKLSGKVDEDGNLLKDDRRHKSSKDSGRYHSNWLSMMYPRLFLARNLLTDDGVIFVSIGDDEIHNLRLLMNEVFGEENFVSQFIWNSSTGGGIRGKYVNVNHEYCLCYAKNMNILPMFYAPLSEEAIKQYNKTDERGLYREKDFAWKTESTNQNQKYLIKCPDGSFVKPADDYSFRFVEETFFESLKNGDVVFKETKTSPLVDENNNQAKWNIYIKKHLGEGEGAPTTLVPKSLVGISNLGTAECKELFDGKTIFNNPKSTSYLSYYLSIGLSKNTDIILDFFSGSGTTAHAVMALNAEDGGNRKYIMVQYPEATEEGSEAHKAGYTSIPEIARERIRRAGKKILEEKNSKDGLFDTRETPLDTGFKSFVVGSSNFKQRRADQIDDQTLFGSLEAHLTTIKSHSTPLSMLYELILKHGVSLTEHITIDRIGDKEFFDLGNGALLVCLEQSITQALVDGLMARKPSRIIMLDIGFQGNDALLKNTHLQCEHDKISFQTL